MIQSLNLVILRKILKLNVFLKILKSLRLSDCNYQPVLNRRKLTKIQLWTWIAVLESLAHNLKTSLRNVLLSGLEQFSSCLSKFTRYSRLHPLATLNYAPDMFTTASIVSSIEFDKDRCVPLSYYNLLHPPLRISRSAGNSSPSPVSPKGSKSTTTGSSSR